MASSSTHLPPRAAPAGSTPPARGNALPIPQSFARNSRSQSLEGYREPSSEQEPIRNSFSSRYQSPRSGRFSTDSLPSSYGSEGTHTLGVLRRPKDRRKGGSGSFVQQAGLQIRTEGFDTGGSAFGSAAQLQPQSAIDQEPKGSPAKQPGLLSRTFSSRTDSAALKEKLEHCLENKPSLGEDIDGESVSFLRSLQAKHDVFKAATVTSAFNIANFSYNDKQRSQSIMKQCADTACILADLGADEATVAAALLKDTLLQSMMTEQQLYRLVPQNVADLVVKVGRLDDICHVRQEMVEACKGASLDPDTSQRISHLLLTLADVHGVLIKLADRLAALQNAAPGSPGLDHSAKEALEVFAPIANRLGVWSIKAALEDLAFQILHPAEHAELHGKLKESEDRGTIEAALETLSGVVSARGLEGVDFSGRPKNLYGVMRKMKDKHKGLNQVYDVRALRVVVKSKHDCYAVLQEVHRLWPEVKDRFKDYIRHPKGNGYQSLHTVVEAPDGRPMEIQIRTDKMHFIAEYGVAAHWRYKERDATTRGQAETQQVNWARWLISWTLELKDSKCRPKGSPPGDSALASLANQICSFPTHVPGCKFAEFASRVAPRPVSEEELAGAPALVVLQNHTKGTDIAPTSIEELPPRCTIGELPAVLDIPADAHIFVNTEEAAVKTHVLAHGDRVEVFAASPPQGLLTPEQLEAQRQRLQRLFGRSAPEPGHKFYYSDGNKKRDWELQQAAPFN